LYGGEVKLVYNDAKHSYHVIEGDQKFKVPSVTTICGIIDKSAALTQWASNSAVDQIEAAIKPDIPYTDVYLGSVLKTARFAHRSIKADAANVGSQAHSWLEAYFKHGLTPEPAEDERVRNCVHAALEWMGEHKVEKVEIEKRVYSRLHRFSGTLDKLAVVDGVLSLLDWKSSKALYPEYRLQTSAYVGAYEEENPEVSIRQRILIKLGKHDGEFEAHTYERSSQDSDYDTFLAALKLYNGLKEIK
jgi:hypothetical protein